MLENTEGVMQKDNREKLATVGTQDTGQINVREYRRGNGFSRLSFFITPSVFSNMYLSCFMCTQCCQFLLNVLFNIPSVFSNIDLSCVMCIMLENTEGVMKKDNREKPATLPKG
jgi:hypothetical protein